MAKYIISDSHPLPDAQAGPISEAIPVRRIGSADLLDALRQGMADFWSSPTHLVFLGLMYPIIGIFFAGLAFGYNMLPILFPLMSGFALVGPIAAIGLYEISRRKEQGLDISWQSMADLFRSPAMGSIAAVGVLLMVIFLAWLMTAQALYQSLFGWHAPESMSAFLSEVFTTRNGWWLIIAGNALGRNVGAIPAILTSIRAVAANPGPMLLWAVIIGALLFVGFIPLFIGLAVVLPVLGHATWHLYRRIVP
jgi:uncharacterized membrane protein